MEKNNCFSSSSEGTQKSIYLWFRNFEKPRTDVKTSTWYKLDPTQFNSKEYELTLISDGSLNDASSAVAWESTIYVIGGNSRRRYVNQSGSYSYRHNQEVAELNRTREVYYLDTRCPDLGWKMGPALNSPRTKVGASVKSGTIYAFRGGELAAKQYRMKLRKPPRDDGMEPEVDHGPRDENYGEALDPLFGDWRSITGPDQDTETEVEKLRKLYPYGNEPKISAMEASHGVRVARSYLYELESNMWRPLIGQEKISSENLDAIWSGCIQGLGGKSVRPPALEDYAHPEFLVDIREERFCLIWESPERGLHCTKFRVSVHDDGDGVVSVLATVEAFRIFSNYKPRLDGYGSDLLKQCLAL